MPLDNCPLFAKSSRRRLFTKEVHLPQLCPSVCLLTEICESSQDTRRHLLAGSNSAGLEGGEVFLSIRSIHADNSTHVVQVREQIDNYLYACPEDHRGPA